MARGRLALAVLALGAFAFGTGQYAIAGVLEFIARDLGAPLESAGNLVVAHAIGIALGAPLAAVLTGRMDRRHVLLGALCMFAAASAPIAISDRMESLLIARFLCGTAHGLFIATASAVAARLVDPRQAGRAIAMVLGGVVMSMVLGVPLGTWLSPQFGWRAPFTVSAALALVCMGLAAIVVPAMPSVRSVPVRLQLAAALSPPVVVLLLIAAMATGGQFSALVFIAPFMVSAADVTAQTVALLLLVYGTAGWMGMILGGFLADRFAMRVLLASNLLLVIALAGLHALGPDLAWAAALTAGWGFAGYAMIPVVQLRVVAQAGAGAEIAASLAASAVNAGVAFGSLLCAWAVGRDGASAAFAVAAGLTALALPFSCISARFARVRA